MLCLLVCILFSFILFILFIFDCGPCSNERTQCRFYKAVGL
jgi:hypothetical protein